MRYPLGERIVVGTEFKRIQLVFHADARLATAAGGVARYFADAAGLANGAVAQFQSATVAACRESFEHLTGENQRLEVTLTRFADRIEVALAYKGAAIPAIGLDTIAGLTEHGERPGSPLLKGIDRVQFETQGNSAVTRLTKFIGPRASAN